jgi:hypothetical protein
MKTININGKDYKVKYTIRALFIFEQITGKAFKLETMLDSYIFYYSMILANNKDQVLQWDEFLDALDENPKLLQDMEKVMKEEDGKNSLFNDGEESNNSSEKKNFQ